MLTVVFEYVYWQFWSGPRWLAGFLWNVQLYLWKLFSVPVMLRTLFAHWRRDSVAHTGALSQILMAFVWNSISRGVGVVVRSVVLFSYFLCALGASVLSAFVFGMFLLWPVLVVIGGLLGVAVLVG